MLSPIWRDVGSPTGTVHWCGVPSLIQGVIADALEQHLKAYLAKAAKKAG